MPDDVGRRGTIVCAQKEATLNHEEKEQNMISLTTRKVMTRRFWSRMIILSVARSRFGTLRGHRYETREMPSVASSLGLVDETVTKHPKIGSYVSKPEEKIPVLTFVFATVGPRNRRVIGRTEINC